MSTLGMTTFRQAMKACVDKLELENVAELYQFMHAINTGYFPSWIINAIGQNHHGKYDVVDAYSARAVLSLVAQGRLFVQGVFVGKTPSKDKQTEENNAKLQSAPQPFKATFAPTAHGCDGVLSWTKSITVETYKLQGQQEFNIIHPHKAPLEVGTQAADKTFFQLVENGSLARWPYGSNTIWLLWCDYVGNSLKWGKILPEFDNFDNAL